MKTTKAKPGLKTSTTRAQLKEAVERHFGITLRFAEKDCSTYYYDIVGTTGKRILQVGLHPPYKLFNEKKFWCLSGWKWIPDLTEK